MRELISVAVALATAYVLGWCGRGEREKRLAQQPKTLKQLTREQGIKPFDPATFPTADPELFTEEDLASWDAAIREARS